MGNFSYISFKIERKKNDYTTQDKVLLTDSTDAVFKRLAGIQPARGNLYYFRQSC